MTLAEVHRAILERDYTTKLQPTAPEVLAGPAEEQNPTRSWDLGDVNGLFAFGPYWVVLRLVLDGDGLQVAAVEIQAHAPSPWGWLNDLEAPDRAPTADERQQRAAETKARAADYRAKLGRRPAINVTRTLRRLPLPSMVRDLKTRYMVHLRETFAEGVPESWPDWILENLDTGTATGGVSEEALEAARKSMLEIREARRTTGRAVRYDEAHFKRVASVYRQALDGGKPTAAVADAFDVTYTTAAKWVRKCREMDSPLLPRTTRGKAKGDT